MHIINVKISNVKKNFNFNINFRVRFSFDFHNLEDMSSEYAVYQTTRIRDFSDRKVLMNNVDEVRVSKKGMCIKKDGRGRCI